MRYYHYDETPGANGPGPSALFLHDHVELTTVGIDIGSSTSHLTFSRLHLHRAGHLLSSRYVVVDRQVLHRSAILLTPYVADYTINADRLGAFVRQSYQEAGLKPEDVDTGALILTGEAVKRSNARAIAELFASEAGKFVCATAGPNLEAIMAANGSGAVALSRRIGGTVLNVDVGGGTSKLALIRKGEVLETAAINVGGRLIALDRNGRTARIEPAGRLTAEALGIDLRLGEPLAEADRARIAVQLADCLIELTRRGPLSPLAERLLITPPLGSTGPVDVVTFSGGVAEHIYEREDRDFGDLALHLAAAIRARAAALPAPVHLATERIRATVIGASQFTVQLSGNTIAVSRPEVLPLRNLPVIHPRLPAGDDVSPEALRAAIEASCRRLDLEEGEQSVALAIEWNGTPAYVHLRNLADGIVRGLPRTLARGLPLILVFNHDFGKLVGGILRDDFGVRNDLVSVDNIQLQEFDTVDIGAVIQPAEVVPVVVKSLVFPEADGQVAEVVEGEDTVPSH